MSGAPMGTLTSGNLVLTNSNGSVNFMSLFASAPQIGVLATIFDKSFAIDSGSDSFDTIQQLGSSVARDAGKNYLSLRAPNTGSSAVLQTKQYVSSSVGSSRIVTAVANLDPLGMMPANPGIIARVGSFDSGPQRLDDPRGDGYFFQYSSTGLACVRRTSGTGSDVDEIVPQRAWNLDALNGTGLSQFTLSATRASVFLIVYETSASSACSVKLGVIGGNNIIFCHRFDQSDAHSVRTISLPVRFELRNDSGSTNITTELRAISCSVSSSGGLPKGVRRSCGLKASARDLSSQTTSAPVLSIRLKQSFARATARLVGLHLTSTTTIYYEIVKNGLLTSPTWTSAADDSIMELDKTATALTGGTVLASGYACDKQTINVALPEMVPLASTIAGVCDIYSLNVVCLLSSGLIWASLDVSEIA